jgi:hypothetical protein
MEPYSFEYEGVSVTYQRATVRTGLEATRIRQKLIEALGYSTEMPLDEYANADTFADTMARCKADAPWWCHSNMTGDQIRTAYDLFLDQDETLYTLFNRAYIATSPPKKTAVST